MPYTGLTPTTSINGVDFLTASVFNAIATIADEVLHLDGATQLYGSLTVQRSQISSTSTRASTGDNRAGTAILNAVAASQSSLSIESFSNEHSFYLNTFTDSIFIETGLKHRVLVFTNPNASIQNSSFIGFYWMEVNGSFSSFANVSFIDSVLGILNWLAGRLDLTGINIPSTTSGYYCALGQGSNNNKFFFWNPVALDFSKVLHTSAEHRAYKGFTVSWQFSDTSGGISNTLVIYRDDRNSIGGSKTELGRYLTNSSGIPTGTFDSKQGVNGANVERPSLWILTQQSAPTGAIVAQSPPNTFYTAAQVNGSYVDHLYDVQDILVEIEVRSYLHSAPDLIGAPTAEIGRINPDESVNFYRPFPLLVDEGVTITNTTTVSGYSGIAHTTIGFSLSGTLTLSQVYDSRKLYWYNNDGVSVPSKVGSVADFGAANITIASPTANPTTTAKYDRATHTGTLTLSATGSYSARPWDVPAVGVVTVASGSTNLQGWTFATGATINVSSGTAIVTVDDTTGITAGAGVTLQTPQAAITISGIPTGANAIVGVIDLNTNAQTFPTIADGTATITVELSHNYFIACDARGYLRQTVTLAGNVPSYTFNLPNFRALYELGTSRASDIFLNTNNFTVMVGDGTPNLSLADVFHTIEDYLATPEAVFFSTPPYPVIVSTGSGTSRQYLFFPYDAAANTPNPVRIKPKSANTSDPTLTDFVIVHEGSTAPLFSIFDFTTAGGRTIRFQTEAVAASITVSGAGALTTDQAAQLAAINNKTANLPSSPASTADVQVTVLGGFSNDDRTALEALPTLTQIEASTVIAKEKTANAAKNAAIAGL
jgi:hypothetical protein